MYFEVLKKRNLSKSSFFCSSLLMYQVCRSNKTLVLSVWEPFLRIEKENKKVERHFLSLLPLYSAKGLCTIFFSNSLSERAKNEKTRYIIQLKNLQRNLLPWLSRMLEMKVKYYLHVVPWKN